MKTSSRFVKATIFSGVMALTGCGSTPNLSADGSAMPRNVDIAGSKEIVWDNSESFALNVSKMGRPADLGIGLRDSDNPKGEKIDKESNSLLSLYSGYVVGGVLGAFGSLSMDALSAKARTWKPYFIQTLESGKISRTSDASSYMKPLASKLDKVLADKFNGSYVIDVFYNNRSNSSFSNIIAISGEFCDLAARYDTNESIPSNPLRELTFRVSPNDFDTISQHPSSCYVSLESKVVGEYNGRDVVSHKISSTNIGVFFGLSLTGDAGMPTVFPNEFIGLNINDGSTSVYTFNAPFVLYNQDSFYFDKSEKSKPF